MMKQIVVKLMWGAIFALLALVVLYFYDTTLGTPIVAKANIVGGIRGTDPRPFVYRQFVPILLRGLDRAIPSSVRTKVDQRVRDSGVWARHVDRWEKGSAVHYIAFYVLCFICFLSCIYVWSRSSMEVYHMKPGTAHFAACCVFMMIPIFFLHSKFYYDPFTLALFSLGVLLILERRNGLFYPLLAIAVLNKETAILLIPIWLIINHHWGAPRKLLITHAAFQTAIAGAILLALRIRFQSNPGMPMEFHLLDHNLPYQYLGLKMPVISFVTALGLPLSLSCRTGMVPQVIQRTFLLNALVLVTATLFGGWIEELRDYLELLPLISLMLAPLIHQIITGDRCKIASRF